MTISRSSAAALLSGALLADPVVAIADEILMLPSGASVTVLDVITDVPGPGLTYRFRFLAPHIVAPQDHAITVSDMQFLCDSHVLARIGALGPIPDEIVITLLDRPVVFGEISPEAVQFFEAYRPMPEGCAREDF